jgi:uncharacterized protein (TIGR04376 family)
VGLFDDLSKFLENRLEEFLRNNPHLELEALLEQLREQERDTSNLIVDLQLQEKRAKEDILATAQEIKKWHERVEKAKASGRMDLANAAQLHEEALLREGNQKWGHMLGIKERITQSKELLGKIQQRRQEVQTTAASQQATRAQTKTQSTTQNTGWSSNTSTSSRSSEDLEEKFRRWEMDDELEKLKRNMGK